MRHPVLAVSVDAKLVVPYREALHVCQFWCSKLSVELVQVRFCTEGETQAPYADEEFKEDFARS